ncbi:hypothetical protein BDV41DRAFT_541457 [Aspergillus transmontanensis]|uniref:Uncharacterized protein n=1 Tax=Aspergillus transmontanensis TaxID=1034304 RepID=A0A5N6VUY7_9EURO|nr:hypothetical protein BDV41DRAFT_541457 [Aspergillus transmontanensis]
MTSLFEERIRKVIRRMRGHNNCAEWQETLKSWTDEYIVEQMTKWTTPAVKDLLNREEPPTFEDLLAIPWETTNELGVYLKLIFEDLENPTAFSHFVYIGSAISWFAGGLRNRRRQHETKPGPRTKWTYTDRLAFGRVKRKLKFGTLFKVEMGCLFPSTKKEARVRHLCLFAEAMYVYIFGAFGKRNETRLSACPFGNPTNIFTWKGTLSHCALSEPLQHRGFKKKWTSGIDLPTHLDGEARAAMKRRKNREGVAAWRKRYPTRYLEAQKRQNEARREPGPRERARLYSAKYRIENTLKIQARKATMTEVEKAIFRAHKAAQMRGYRAAKKAQSEPIPPRIVPAKNIRRNAMRKAQRAGDVFQKEKAKFQQRVNRARDRLKKAKATGDIQTTREAALALNIAEVERWEFAVQNRIPSKIVPSKEARRIVNEHRAKEAQDA